MNPNQLQAMAHEYTKTIWDLSARLANAAGENVELRMTIENLNAELEKLRKKKPEKK